MAVLVTCACGKSYSLKDEFAGKLIKCPACGQMVRAAGEPRTLTGDPAFARDKFLLRQKHLSINHFSPTSSRSAFL